MVDRVVYNDAIVNIFTRLNTAGRALTREEITFAWIKIGWDPARTEGHAAVACFETLQGELKQSDIDLKMDELVQAVAMMWAVLCNGGALLRAEDLLRGDRVRPMAQDLVARWDTVAENLRHCAEALSTRGLIYGQHYRSLNAASLLWTWRLLAGQWLAEHPLRVSADDGFRKAVDEAFQRHGDRWLFVSQWAGRWSRATEAVVARYASQLAEDWGAMRSVTDPNGALALLDRRMRDWLRELEPEAVEYVRVLDADSRAAVPQYFLPLWLWHRLDESRWEMSSIPLRLKMRQSTRLEVDHLVAVDLWQSLARGRRSSAGEESRDAEDSLDETGLHSLGNCCLLEKGFNISKGARSLRSFLKEVYEFKEGRRSVEEWADALSIEPAQIDPEAHDEGTLRGSIERRTKSMKANLEEYVRGQRERVDV